MQDQTVEDIEPEFGRWVRDQRRSKQISQGELAQLSGVVDASALSRIESGKRSVRLSEAVALAQALDSPFLSAQFTERVDPVRRLTSDVLDACVASDRAHVYSMAAADDLRRAIEVEGAALDRLAELAPNMAGLTADMQAHVLRALADLKRSSGRRREVYLEMLRSAAPEVRAALEAEG
ncbi:helix-turn-helix protein [Microbacterium hydrothermale]|uniref:helix-turn-helix domain-containing protein n=1 Tax=Microbacterium hydrothermale TaxID=857427 RepID=UPI002225FEEC|nr:helix-turn-helix transcriptional regulator [Microbacterium hydrothermale]MCW2165777.1 helix-turn-helix protein [Microbacterium hydrothermale]